MPNRRGRPETFFTTEITEKTGGSQMLNLYLTAESAESAEEIKIKVKGCSPRWTRRKFGENLKPF